MSIFNHYEILGVPYDATEEQITNAYIEKMQVGLPGMDEKYKTAYYILMNDRRRSKLKNAYNDALKNYLCVTGVDKNPISEEIFISTADELFDKYRNTAAHPGTTMDEKEGRKCMEKSKKVLKKFMSAVQ